MKLTELYQIREAAAITVRSIRGEQPETVSNNCDYSFLSLTSLEGSPTHVHGSFACYGNVLKSLEGGPTTVGTKYIASNNQLATLKGSPESIGGHFIVANNPLETLKGATEWVGENFDCRHCTLDSLEGAPSFIGQNCIVTDNRLKTLHSIHKQIKHIGNDFNAVNNFIRSNVLGLMLIDGLRSVFLDIKPVQNIINKHLKGDRDVFACQEELIEAGFEEYAQL